MTTDPQVDPYGAAMAAAQNHFDLMSAAARSAYDPSVQPAMVPIGPGQLPALPGMPGTAASTAYPDFSGIGDVLQQGYATSNDAMANYAQNSAYQDWFTQTQQIAAQRAQQQDQLRSSILSSLFSNAQGNPQLQSGILQQMGLGDLSGLVGQGAAATNTPTQITQSLAPMIAQQLGASYKAGHLTYADAWNDLMSGTSPAAKALQAQANADPIGVQNLLHQLYRETQHSSAYNPTYKGQDWALPWANSAPAPPQGQQGRSLAQKAIGSSQAFGIGSLVGGPVGLAAAIWNWLRG
jgi:hypothetical protein